MQHADDLADEGADAGEPGSGVSIGNQPMARVAELLDHFAGPGEGRRVLARLLASAEPARSIAVALGGSDEFHRLYKVARTCYSTPQGRKDADPALVGVADFDQTLRFPEQFHRFFHPRLGKRAGGFAVIFEALARQPRPLIVETGCLRIPGNWEGDGQSSFMFDALARARQGLFFSIDALPESIETARRALSSAANLICNDSVAGLHALSRMVNGTASLLYLDSFDLDLDNPLPSAVHHILELTAARPLIGPGTIVCVDDYEVLGRKGGKGLILDQFFSAIRAEVLHSGYQKVWVMP